MLCSKDGAKLEVVTMPLEVRFSYKGKIEIYQTDMELYLCPECGSRFWDETLPDPWEDAARQYIAIHGAGDREARIMARRYHLAFP